MTIISKTFLTAMLLISSFSLSAYQTPANPDEALELLAQGNSRFINDQLEHPNRSKERREESAQEQKPHTVILSCADSRVCPEILFDQGIGDLFVVRVAGNILGELERNSIEYSIVHNNSVLIVVLGHEYCGAVDAVMKGYSTGIEEIYNELKPAVDKHMTPDATLVDVVKGNVQEVVAQLNSSDILKERVNAGQLKIVGAYYDLQDGTVEFLK